MSKKILSILLSITMMLSIFSCIDFSAYAVEKFLFGDVTGDGTVDFINDIQGFPYPEIYSGLAKSDCKLVLMHSVQRIGAATKVETNPEEVFTSMMEFFKERIAALVEAGVKRERIILDPGMGFFLGSNPETSILVLKRFPEIQEAFNLQVMIAVSRKSFLGKITGTDVKSRLAPTLAAEMYAYKKGADYLRTHDVKSLSDALKISKALG